MALFRIGYNIDAEHPGANRQAVADAQVNLHSTYTLLLDDHKSGWYFSQQIRARSPETERIARTFMRKDAQGGWDGNLWEAPDGNSPTGFLSPANYMNFLQNLNAPAGTVHQILCEPDVHGERLHTKVQWLCECIKEASRREMRLCVDNIQTVTLDERELNAGYYDPLFFTLSQFPRHILGVHAYWLGDAWLNTSEHLMQSLSYNSQINPAMFINRSDAQLQADYIAQPSKAHLGREELIAARCRKIGAKVPRMVYTEVGPDAVRLAQQGNVNSINGRAAMGYPTMSHYWRVHYPQWMHHQAMAEQVKWLNRAMRDYIVGACLFGYDTAFENGAYHVEDAALQKSLEDYSAEVRSGQSTPPVVEPPPTPTPKTTEERLADLERRVTTLENR